MNLGQWEGGVCKFEKELGGERRLELSLEAIGVKSMGNVKVILFLLKAYGKSFSTS